MPEFLLPTYIFILQHTTANLRAAVVALIIFALFLLLGKIISGYIIKIFLEFTSFHQSKLDNKIIQAFQKPLRYFIIFFGSYLALIYLPLNAAQDQFVYKIFRSAIIILLAWGFYDLAGTHSAISDEMKAKFKIDDILLPFFSKALRFVIVALAIVLCASEWNYDINGFIAGLGLGGLAFALAAKDALANIIGGIVIIMEKPFSIGDWVFTPSVEGSVEDITFRSTRFRTSAQALVTVPNSTLANEAITNWSRMGKRRVSFYLELNRATPVNKIERMIISLRDILVEHPEIHADNVLVSFESFKESSLEILVQYFTKTTNAAENLKIREEINLKIMQLLHDEDISIAFPSRSIYLEKDCVSNRQDATSI